MNNTRNRSIKKGIDSDANRRRRDDTRLQLRKNKREEGLQKRRAMSSANQTQASMTSAEPTAIQTAVNRKYNAADIPSLLATLQKTDSSENELLEAVRGFRKLLSVEQNPPVKEVIDCGALPLFVKLLSTVDDGKQSADFHQIHFEAAWALTNVASTEYTSTVVECHSVPVLVKLLLSGNADVREQSAWCLGNIAGDSPDLRDCVLQNGGMEPLLQNISHASSESLLGNVVWALSNFCRGKPQPKLEYVAPALPHLAQVLHSNHKSSTMDACWALSYISDGEDERIQAVMNSGVTPQLVHFLAHEEACIITPALRTVGNFVTGNEVQTQAVIDANILDKVTDLLVNMKKNIRKETCWLISNIAAGTTDQIDYLMKRPRTLNKVVDAVMNDEWEVRKEATWVLSNITTGGRDDQIQGLIELNAIEALCSTLGVGDSKIIMNVLEAIEKILEVGEKTGKDYTGIIDECDGLDKIEGLQEHQNETIYQKAVDIIERFYGVEEEGDENIVPEVSGNTFAFGLPSEKNTASTGQEQAQQPLQPFNFSA